MIFGAYDKKMEEYGAGVDSVFKSLVGPSGDAFGFFDAATVFASGGWLLLDYDFIAKFLVLSTVLLR